MALVKLEAKMANVLVWALLMFYSEGSDINDFNTADEFTLTDGMSKCLSMKREAARNSNKVQWKCMQLKVDLEVDDTGVLHILRLKKEQ